MAVATECWRWWTGEGGGGRLKREEQRQGKAHELVSTALRAQGKSATSSAERVV